MTRLWRRLWPYDLSPAQNLWRELVSSVLISCSVFALRPLMHKTWAYTVQYAVVWLVASTVWALLRYEVRRRRDRHRHA